MTIRNTLSNWRGSFVEVGQHRRARRQLEHELAEYRTPSERRELSAILERHTAEEPWEFRRALAALDRQTALGQRLAHNGFGARL